MVTHSYEAGDPVGRDRGVEGMSVDGEGVDRVDLFAVAGKHQVALVRYFKVGHRKDRLLCLGLLGGDGPHVEAFLHGVDVDGAVLGTGGGHVKLSGDGHTCHSPIVTRQHLQMIIVIIVQILKKLFGFILACN